MEKVQNKVDLLLDLKENILIKDNILKAITILIDGIANNDCRLVYIFSYLFHDIELDRIINYFKNGNVDIKYLHFFLRDNYYKMSFDDNLRLIEKALNYNNAKELFNIYYDIDDCINSKHRELIIQKLKTLSKKYYFKAIYNEKVALNKGNFLTKLVLKLAKRYTTQTHKRDTYFSNNSFDNEGKYIPTYIVFHSVENIEKAINAYYSAESEVSVTFLINKKGKIKQIIPLTKSAWGNGTSIYPESDIYYRFAKDKTIANRKYNLNLYSFSIANESVDGSLTEKQLQANVKTVITIKNYLARHYNYTGEITLLGHSDIVPITKSKTPGKNFPYEKLKLAIKRETIY
ncbi:MAG: N-acetylmuramoyl-L-alanine amidase [Clostridium sp.]